MSYRRKQRRRRGLVWKMPAWLRFSGKQFLRLMMGLLIAFILILGLRLGMVWKQRTWFGFEPYRLLLLSGEVNSGFESIEVISIWPDTLKTVSLVIPSDTMVTAVGGYGNYRVGSLAKLGQVEGVGNKLLKDSLGYALGLPIHQVYVTKRAEVKGAWKEVMKQSLLGQRSMPEAVEIARLIRPVRIDPAQKTILTVKNVLREKINVDGATEKYFEPALTSRLILEQVRSIWVEAAMMQVAIVNASGKPFMATEWSRFPRNAGYDVVSVTDQQELVDKTTVIFSDVKSQHSPAGKVLAELFPLAEVTVGEVGKYRAQTVIILGRDCFNWLTEREEYLKN